MKHNRTIKVLFTVLLFGVFALAITPKQVLHDVLTNHQHVPVSDDHVAWVGKDRLNCDDENFVAESPFISQTHDLSFQAPLAFPDFSKSYLPPFSFQSLSFPDLRGPPVFS